jgi:hypothetical protein
MTDSHDFLDRYVETRDMIEGCDFCGQRHDHGPVGQATCEARMAMWRPEGLQALVDSWTFTEEADNG